MPAARAVDINSFVNPIPELRKTYVNGIMGSNGPQCIIKKIMKEKTK